MENNFHDFVDEVSELQTAFIDSIIRIADARGVNRGWLLNEVKNSFREACVNTSLDIDNYTPAEAESEGTFEKKISILINRAAFGETQEMLNAEIDKVLDILKKSPMFTGRITLAMEISNRGKSVRPILYKTKYVPKEVIKEPQVEGQIFITNYP